MTVRQSDRQPRRQTYMGAGLSGQQGTEGLSVPVVGVQIHKNHRPGAALQSKNTHRTTFHQAYKHVQYKVTHAFYTRTSTKHTHTQHELHQQSEKTLKSHANKTTKGTFSNAPDITPHASTDQNTVDSDDSSTLTQLIYRYRPTGLIFLGCEQRACVIFWSTVWEYLNNSEEGVTPSLQNPPR